MARKLVFFGLSSSSGGEMPGKRPRNPCYRVPSVTSWVDRKMHTSRPCPFRRPSMAGGRRPLAGTPLHHKHRECATRSLCQGNPLLSGRNVIPAQRCGWTELAVAGR